MKNSKITANLSIKFKKPYKIAGLILCVSVGLAAYIYLARGLSVSDSTLVMPLDDTYIHFQYARQMATGDPYVYNPDQEPTSGATSFLYTPLLAIGYGLGFQGLTLAYWAIAIGLLAMLGSSWLIFLLVYQMPTQNQAKSAFDWQWWIALGVGLSFALSGPFLWASMSGMETSLFVFAVLLSLFTYTQQRQRLALVAMILVSLTRPEGAIVAISMGIAIAWNYRTQWRKALPYLLTPLMASGVQPTVNWLITGSFSATGNQAKSILYNVSEPFDKRIQDVFVNCGHILKELMTGNNAVDGVYMFDVLSALALIVMVWSLQESLTKKRITPPTLVLFWILGLSIAISTLDTAFWHFKRYQLPMMALLFPLAGWFLVRIKDSFLPPKVVLWGSGLVIAVSVMFSLNTARDFAQRYRDNIWVVQHQQMRMAQWVDANLPTDAVVAVHDVGVMRYVGNRATFDVVGLTTKGMAPAWRQGPGTLYDTLTAQHPRPDYFAIYPDIQGLPLLVESGVFGTELARFSLEIPIHTVASATGTQIVTQPDWQSITAGNSNLHQGAILNYFDQAWTQVAEVDIANLVSENAADYAWHNEVLTGGFPSIVHRLDYQDCRIEPCTVTDGGRIITGGERFTLPATDQSNYLVVMRVNAANSATLNVGCSGQKQTVVVPFIPGQWVEIPILLNHQESQFCINTQGNYESYHYWVYEGMYAEKSTGKPPSEFHIMAAGFDSPEFMMDAEMQVKGDEAIVDVTWFTDQDLDADGKVFIHLYDDPNKEPVRQLDAWPMGGAFPPANWLVGAQSERFTLSLEGLPAGEYSLAIGMYDPRYNTRFPIDRDLRLFLGTINIETEN